MTKYDWLWVALRVAGIYLLVHATLALPNAIAYTGMVIWYRLDQTLSESSGSSPLAERTVQVAMTSCFQVVTYFILGAYFLVGARALLRLAAGPDATPRI